MLNQLLKLLLGAPEGGMRHPTCAKTVRGRTPAKTRKRHQRLRAHYAGTGQWRRDGN